MKAKFVIESLKENEEYDYLESPFAGEESSDYNRYDDMPIHNEIESLIDNELDVPEYSREPLSFRVRGEGKIEAVPMAKTKDGAVLMKIGDSYKKFRMEDLIEDDEY